MTFTKNNSLSEINTSVQKGFIVINQVETLKVTQYDLFDGEYKNAKPLDMIFHYLQKVPSTFMNACEQEHQLGGASNDNLGYGMTNEDGGSDADESQLDDDLEDDE